VKQALTRIEARDFEAAERILEAAIEADSADAMAVYQLGLVQARRGRIERAVEYLERAREILGDDPDLIGNLGALLSRLERFEPAIQMLADGTARHPKHASLWINYGSALGLAGRHEAAIEALLRGRDLDPDNPIAYNLLGRFNEARGDLAGARRHGIDALTVKDERAVQAFQTLSKTHDLALRTVEPREGAMVIAISLWGHDPTYTQGAVENVRLAAEHFPGWICRFYHDASVTEAVLQRLRALGAECVAVTTAQRRVHGGFWRFFVADDPLVGRFLCRDADCRLNARERAAVDAWITSGRGFHLMRDHPWHSDLILAGLWGGCSGMLPPIEPLILDLYGDQGDRWDDQAFLGEVIWPMIKPNCLIHDSQFGLFGGVPFPEGSELESPDHVGYSFRLKQRKSTFRIDVANRRKPARPAGKK